MNFSLKSSGGKAPKWSCFWGKRGCVWLHQPGLGVWAWCSAKFPIFHLILEEGDPSLSADRLLESPGSVFWHCWLCSRPPAGPLAWTWGDTAAHGTFVLKQRYFVYLFHSKRRDDLQFSQAVVTNISAQGFREEAGEGEGPFSLQPGWAGCASSSSGAFLNVLYKNYSKREFVEWHRYLEIRECAFLLLWWIPLWMVFVSSCTEGLTALKLE